MGLHLPGLLTILGEHLYSDPTVALREALQNAHDSCQRRRAERREPRYTPRIDVRFSRRGRYLELADNGSGLTQDEIAEFLATIGRSYTGELRAQLEVGGETEIEAAQALIGQFGLGFLSAFLLARRVVLTTRSANAGAAALRFTSSGGPTYELETLEGEAERAPGTTLRLELKAAAQALLDGEVLARVLRLYAGFLPTPVFLADEEGEAEGDGAGGGPVNDLVAPWHFDGERDDYLEFVRERYDVEPLTVLPLRDVVVEVGDDRVTLPLAGVLFVPPASVTSLQEYGDVAVYVRRMFICERERDLLPAWARFVRGVVESPRLRPTVSRESLRQDELFRQARAGLERQLTDHFERLAREEPDAWREIVVAHNDLLKGWALQAPRLFASIADLVHFDTSRGRLTLPQIRAVTGDAIHYFSDESGLNQDRLLFEARGLLVVDASRFAEEAFLQRYATARPGLRLDQIRPGTQAVFQAAGGELERVVAHFEAAGVSVRAVRFAPESLPALLIYPPAHDRLRRIRASLDANEVTGPIAELMQAFLEKRAAGGADATAPVLHVNAGSGLLARIDRLGPGHAAFAPALDLVHQSARFFAGKQMSASESCAAFESAMASLAALLERPGP
jgi:molecular chaperone HtpG